MHVLVHYCKEILCCLVIYDMIFYFIYVVGKRVVSDAWTLDTAQKPYAWQKLNPEGDRPSARM